MDNNATSMVQPSISVIIPVYNGENYLNKTIKNLEAQTFSNFELIFVNDGSTDKTNQILKDFKKHSKLAVTILTQKTKVQVLLETLAYHVLEASILPCLMQTISMTQNF